MDFMVLKERSGQEVEYIRRLKKIWSWRRRECDQNTLYKILEELIRHFKSIIRKGSWILVNTKY